MGMGETPEDRVDMAFMLKELNIKSIPVNMLNPIPKTPFENNVRLGSEDIKRIVAVYRFILPKHSFLNLFSCLFSCLLRVHRLHVNP